MSALTSITTTTRLLPLRLPRVCVAIVGDDAVEMIEKAEAVVRENPFFEFRLDYLKQPAAALSKLKKFFDLHPEVIAIGTCRRAPNGGRFKGSVAAQIEVLSKAAAIGCQLVDIELETAEALKASEFQRLHSRAAIVLSYHDFRSTKKLEETFARMREFPADFYKIVTTATSLSDNVTMMKFLEQKSYTHSVIGLCMGEQGIISRVLALRAGSVFTFAAANPGEETAPGQVSLRTLRDTYRIFQVDAATRVYGVAGDPVAHSLSPVMMNTAFRRENVNAVYLALHAKKLDDLLACIRNIPISGVSVTMPYKQEIVPHLDNTDPLTAKVGACNTVVRGADGRIFGFNTDVAGVVRPLERRLTLASSKILVIGAGGAARAAVFGLKERGADVYIINRTPANGQKLAKLAKAKYLKRTDLKKYTFDCIINATPLGMEGAPKQSPLSEKEIRTKYAFDLVYSSPETPFGKAAASAGATVISGGEMFVQQGARQFEIWTGKPAPAVEMQNVVDTELAARAARKAASKNGNDTHAKVRKS
ncbi:MAG TPA: shikimate dehydrogenase [Terriglobales bacterium]|nr:shikimate dehydrogenase [Terriglobales bacterium]